MDLFVPLALFGWIPAVFVLFAVLPPRRAVLVSLIGGWLFLPIASYPMADLPDYGKTEATCLSVLVASLVFHSDRWASLRPGWADIPMLLWCLCPLSSSLANGLGAYDGLSAVARRSVMWLIPYAIGRVYFRNVRELREVAIAVFVGGLVYVPFCLYEVRMSPQLHRLVYGMHQHSFAQTIRPGGGYRPTVFMQHGLMVGLWMTAAALVGIWLTFRGTYSRVAGIPAWLLAAVQLITTILCKSFGAILLLFFGLAVLFSAKWVRHWLPIVGLFLLPAIYVAVRAPGGWTGEDLVNVAEATVGKDRANSLSFRLAQETILADKAMQRPIFGWGSWGRSRVYDERGHDIAVTDGLWIIAFGQNGLLGVVSLLATVLLPSILCLRRFPVRQWSSPNAAPVAALSVVLLVYMADSLLNAMVNPMFHLVIGSLASAALPQEPGFVLVYETPLDVSLEADAMS